MALPVLGRTSPAKSGDTIKCFSPFFTGTVTQCCQVRQQARVPEKKGYCKISRDRKHVPQQRRIKVHPQWTTCVGIRQYKKGVPYTTHVKDRKLARTHYRKDRHCFSRTVYTGSPALAKQ